jgi:hypothetical protein
MNREERIVQAFTSHLEGLRQRIPDPLPSTWSTAASKLAADYSVNEILAVITYLGTDTFWRSRILALPVLVEPFPRLLLKVQDEGIPAPAGPGTKRANITAAVLAEAKRDGLTPEETQDYLREALGN